MNKVVEQILKKELFKRGGVMASREAVEAAYKSLETRMKPLGLDINLIKSEKDYNQALGFVKNLEDQIFKKSIEDSAKGPAKIFDLEGKRLDPKKPIMGGTQSEEDMLQKSIKKNIDEATKKGDFTGIKNQVLRDPDIAREFAMMKKFPTRTAEGEEAIPLAMRAKFDDEMGIKKMAKEREIDYNVEKLVSDFKKFGNASDKDIQTILKSGKAGQIPYVMDNYGMSYSDVINTLKKGDPLIEGMAKGGRAGFSDGTPSIKLFPRASGKQVEQEVGPGIKISERDLNYGITGLLQGDKFFGGAEIDKGKVKIDVLSPEGNTLFKDTMSKPDAVNFILGMGDSKGDKFQIKTDKDFENMQLILKKSFAEGGRAGFKVGSPSKRLFLKTAGGLAALITAIKSGLIGVPKKEVTKQVVKESVKDVSNAPPDYFFNLANKIKNLGKESKVKPQERVNEYNYKGKDGSEYTLTEDITTGDMQIVKDKGGVGIADDKTFDTIQDRTVMEYKPPKQDFDPDTEKVLKEGAEYDEYKVGFDMDGTPADAEDISDIIKKEIIEEASDVPQKKIKRAGGGVAYMLGE